MWFSYEPLPPFWDTSADPSGPLVVEERDGSLRAHSGGPGSQPADDSSEPAASPSPTPPLCTWCGVWRGDKRCARCKVAAYCSKPCQVAHWGAGGHKASCCSEKTTPPPGAVAQAAADRLHPQPLEPSPYLPVAAGPSWSEYELAVEDEGEDELDGIHVKSPNGDGGAGDQGKPALETGPDVERLLAEYRARSAAEGEVRDPDGRRKVLFSNNLHSFHLNSNVSFYWYIPLNI